MDHLAHHYFLMTYSAQALRTNGRPDLGCSSSPATCLLCLIHFATNLMLLLMDVTTSWPTYRQCKGLPTAWAQNWGLESLSFTYMPMVWPVALLSTPWHILIDNGHFMVSDQTHGPAEPTGRPEVVCLEIIRLLGRTNFWHKVSRPHLSNKTMTILQGIRI